MPGSACGLAAWRSNEFLEGHGYELTGADVTDAYGHFMAAAERLGVADDARQGVLAMAIKAKQGGAEFADILIRRCSPNAPAHAAVWTPPAISQPTRSRGWRRSRTRR